MAGLPLLDHEHPIGVREIAAFRRDGHVLVRGLATGSEVAAYRPHIAQALDAVAAGRDRQGRVDDYGRLFTQVTNLWRMDEAVRAFVLARRFASVAARLMDVAAVRLYHDQALFKEPGAEATPWHVDEYYWPLDTPHTVTMWMALVDVPPEMGPMSFVSGSHLALWRPGPISEDGSARLEREITLRGFPIAQGASLSAGDATFHSGRTLHSARPNRTPSRREVFTVIYFADGARVRALDNANRVADRDAFLPGLGAGDVAASELNPLLYP